MERTTEMKIIVDTWLVVWNMFIFPIILGISSSQLTKSIIFQRGRLNHQPDTVYGEQKRMWEWVKLPFEMI